MGTVGVAVAAMPTPKNSPSQAAALLAGLLTAVAGSGLRYPQGT